MNRNVCTSREIVRHALGRLGLHSVLTAWRASKGQNVKYLRSKSRSEAFRRIYDDAIWTLGRSDVPLSGTGSSISATLDIRIGLPRLLKKIECRTLLDVGCGDFEWMGSLDMPFGYIGVDIVPSVIEQNIKKHGSSSRKFICLDAVTDDLPEADAVLCREVLFHLSFADGLALLRNLSRKPRKYLVTTTDRSTLFNADVRSGDFRPLNLQCRPFRFPEPAAFLSDAGVMPGRRLALWKFDELPVF